MRLLIWVLNLFRRYRLRYCGKDVWNIVYRNGDKAEEFLTDRFIVAWRKRAMWNWYGP